MALLFLAKEFFVGVTLIILVGVIIVALLKFLQSRAGRKLTRQRQIGSSNRAQRRKAKALSRRRRK